jgi:chromosome partitioning protein
VKSLERGLTVFDLPPEKVEMDLAQWKPVLDWLNPVLIPMVAPETRRESVLPVRRPSVLGAARPLNELAAGGGVLLRRPNPA